MPSVTTQVATFEIIKALGLINSKFSVILLYIGADVVMIYVFLQFMKGIPVELDEAAKIEGCSYFGIYWRIILPLLKPAIVTCAILKGVGVYNEYYAANLYLQDANLKTIAIALYSFTGPMGSKYNLICAGVIITLLPMLILFLIFQKQIYSGIAAGSVKE